MSSNSDESTDSSEPNSETLQQAITAFQFLGLLVALLYLNASGVNMMLVLEAVALYVGVGIAGLGGLMSLSWAGVIGER